MKNHTCCFTGHRKIPRDETQNIAARVKEHILALYRQYINTFLCGGALGFDLLAAKTVLELKAQGFELTLIMVLPCKDQAKYWNPQEALEYNSVLQQADEVFYLCETYTKSCMQKRNRIMVENACCCLAYLTKDRSGTSATVNYARKLGLTIINIG